MTRLAVLRRHPKRTLAGLTVALAAVGVAVSSGASFTSESSNATTFTAGTLTHTNTESGVIGTATIADMKPGDGTNSAGTGADTTSTTGPFAGTITLENNGNLAGDFAVTASATGTAYDGTTPAPAQLCGGTCESLDGALKVKIDVAAVPGDPGEPAVEVFNGNVSDLATADLGTFSLDPAATRTYDVYFYLPTATGNAYQGGDATTTLTFEETQQ